MPTTCIVIGIIAAIVVAAVKWPRFTFYFDRNYRLIVFVSGFVMEVGAIARWDEWQPWSSILAGVGGSVLATVLVGFLGPDGDKVYQTFLRLGVTEFYSSRNRFQDDEWVTGCAKRSTAVFSSVKRMVGGVTTAVSGLHSLSASE
jgi:hypothetical protein